MMSERISYVCVRPHHHRHRARIRVPEMTVDALAAFGWVDPKIAREDDGRPSEEIPEVVAARR